MTRHTEIIKVADTELCIRDGHSDRALVLLHGIGGNYTSFNQIANQLPSDITLVAWNAPGYGGSMPIDTHKPTACDYAKRLNEVVEQLELEQFTLLGHSLGTLIATQYAHDYPLKVDGLILVSCAEGYSMPVGSELPAKTQQRLTDLDAKGPQVFAQERAPRLIHKPEERPEILEAAIEAMAAIRPDGYAQAVHMLSAGALSLVASNTAIQSLIIAGAEDKITPVIQGRQCHEALVSASCDIAHMFTEVPNAGHLVHQEQPAIVAKCIQDFTGWESVTKLESTA